MSPTSAKVMINTKFMMIIVVFDYFLSWVINLIKIINFKFDKIDLNTVSKTSILDI